MCDTDIGDGLGAWMAGKRGGGICRLVHPEDCESTSSIVEHPLAEGESPQWRHMIRSPSTCHDVQTQTDDLDAMFTQKNQALDELEEDIAAARDTLAEIQEEISIAASAPRPAPAPPPTTERQLVSLQLELTAQRHTMHEMSVQMRYLTQLVEQLLITTSAGK